MAIRESLLRHFNFINFNLHKIEKEIIMEDEVTTNIENDPDNMGFETEVEGVGNNE